MVCSEREHLPLKAAIIEGMSDPKSGSPPFFGPSLLPKYDQSPPTSVFFCEVSKSDHRPTESLRFFLDLHHPDGCDSMDASVFYFNRKPQIPSISAGFSCRFSLQPSLETIEDWGCCRTSYCGADCVSTHVKLCHRLVLAAARMANTPMWSRLPKSSTL